MAHSSCEKAARHSDPSWLTRGTAFGDRGKARLLAGDTAGKRRTQRRPHPPGHRHWPAAARPTHQKVPAHHVPTIPTGLDENSHKLMCLHQDFHYFATCFFAAAPPELEEAHKQITHTHKEEVATDANIPDGRVGAKMGEEMQHVRSCGLLYLRWEHGTRQIINFAAR